MWPSFRATPSQPSRYATDTAEYLIAALMTHVEMTQRAAAYEQEVYYYRCSDEKERCIKLLSFTGIY